MAHGVRDVIARAKTAGSKAALKKILVELCDLVRENHRRLLITFSKVIVEKTIIVNKVKLQSSHFRWSCMYELSDWCCGSK